MKKLIAIFIIVVTSFGLAKGQINMSSNGFVGIGSLPSSSYSLIVTSTLGYHGQYITVPSNTTGSVYGLSSNFSNSTNGSINRAIYGYVYNATATNVGQAYGVSGIAGNCTNGYNFGVFGQLLGSKSGASVFGTIGTFTTPPSDLTVANAQYAGYFVGNVKITGSIWAASGTITGSDERIKKEVQVLNSSADLFKLKPKQYKLKSYSELLKEFKTTSDTTKENNVTIHDSEEYEKLHYGFLAQDIKQVYPDLVYISPDGTLGVDYQGFIPMIIDQLQKTQQSSQVKDYQLDDLENRVTKLENQIIELQSELEKCCNSTSKLKSATISDDSNPDLGNTEAAVLLQNTPNPFSASSIISYRIPQNAQDSKICIYDLNGKQLQSYPINKSGNGSIIINSHRFNPGIFLYTLIIDKKEIDTKRMIVTE